MSSTDSTRVFKGLVSMPLLSKKLGINVRRLYRLRKEGVFGETYRLNDRAVYYDTLKVKAKIERYMERLKRKGHKWSERPR